MQRVLLKKEGNETHDVDPNELVKKFTNRECGNLNLFMDFTFREVGRTTENEYCAIKENNKATKQRGK